MDINWLDPETCEPKFASLGVTRYRKLDGAAGEEVIRATAVEVAKWVLAKLKEYRLVPEAHLSVKITEFVRAACTDNASAEVLAVVGELQLTHSPCVCHTLDLVVGYAVQPGIGAELRKKHAEDTAAAQAAGDDPPAPLETPLHLNIMKLASLAKYCKKGRGTALFFAEQRREGVAEPRALVSRAATRWSNSVAVIKRAILLRRFLPYICAQANRDAISAMDWAIMIQCAAFLQLFAVAITAMQSRTLLIGEHVGYVYSLTKSILNPELSDVLMLPHDFEPTPEQLNTRGFSLDDCTDVKPLAASLVPETAQMVDRMQRNLKWRLGDPAGGPHPKFQLNSDATMQAMVFDPALNYLVLGDPEKSNLMFSFARKVALNSYIIQKGKAMAAEMAASAGAAAPAPEEDARAAKQQKLDPRAALLEEHMRAQGATSARAAGTSGREDSETDLAFLKEFKKWKEHPPATLSMSQFWSSALAKAEYPILRRMFLSICSTRPDNAELERHFSALALLLAPLRRGPMKWQTIERKMFLVLNKQHWRLLPDVPDDDPYLHELMVAVKLAQPKPKTAAELNGAPPPPPVELATAMDPLTYVDSDAD